MKSELEIREKIRDLQLSQSKLVTADNYTRFYDSLEGKIKLLEWVLE